MRYEISHSSTTLVKILVLLPSATNTNYQAPVVIFEIENDAKSCCKVINSRWFDGRQIKAFVFSPINENSIQQQDIDDFLAGIMQEEPQAQASSTVEPISEYTSVEAKVKFILKNLEGSFLFDSF